MWGEPDGKDSVMAALNISTHSPRVGRTRGSSACETFVEHFNSLAPCGANPCISFKKTLKSKFQLTRPVWGEPARILNSLTPANISTHSPRVGRTTFFARRGSKTAISTHSPRVGRTTMILLAVLTAGDFNSLAPCGANHRMIVTLRRRMSFQLTRPVWGEPSCTPVLFST